MLKRVVITLLTLIIVLALVLGPGSIGDIKAAGTTTVLGLSSGDWSFTKSGGWLDAMKFYYTGSPGNLNQLELLLDDSTPAGQVHLGVYSNINGTPGKILLDAGQTRAVNGWVSIRGLNLALTANTYYWLVYSLDSANTVRGKTSNAMYTHYFVKSSFGALPGTFPQNGGLFNTDQYCIRAMVAVSAEPPASDRIIGLNSGTVTSQIPANTWVGVQFPNPYGAGKITKVEILIDDPHPEGKIRLGLYTSTPCLLRKDLGDVPVKNGWVSISGLDVSVNKDSYLILAFVLEKSNGVRSQVSQNYSSYLAPYPYGPLLAKSNSASDAPLYGLNTPKQYVMRAIIQPASQ